MGGELLSGQRKANFGFPSLAVHNITDQKTKVNNKFLDELKGGEVISPLPILGGFHDLIKH